jgi:hypothetical protein
MRAGINCNGNPFFITNYQLMALLRVCVWASRGRFPFLTSF